MSLGLSPFPRKTTTKPVFAKTHDNEVHTLLFHHAPSTPPVANMEESSHQLNNHGTHPELQISLHKIKYS